MGPVAVCPRQDSNLRHRLRRAVLYPLSYGGGKPGKRNSGALERVTRTALLSRLGGPVLVGTADAEFGGRVLTGAQRVDELLDARVAGLRNEQLITPGLQRNRRLQARVRREREIGNALYFILEGRDVGRGRRLRVVGDPHRAVLEHVHGVLVRDLVVVDRAAVVRPELTVVAAGRWAARVGVVVDRAGYVQVLRLLFVDDVLDRLCRSALGQLVAVARAGVLVSRHGIGHDSACEQHEDGHDRDQRPRSLSLVDDRLPRLACRGTAGRARGRRRRRAARSCRPGACLPGGRVLGQVLGRRVRLSLLCHGVVCLADVCDPERTTHPKWHRCGSPLDGRKRAYAPHYD